MHGADADSIFGGKTEASVRAFQADHGLKVDGIVGPITMGAIDALGSIMKPDTVVLASGLIAPRERCWPIAKLADGRRPEITSRHAVHNPERSTHYGVDLFYRRAPHETPAKGDGGTPKWIIPPNTPMLATADGEVVFAGPSKTGWRVWIRHVGDVCTGYFHMTKLDGPAIARGKTLELGKPIGIVGASPLDAAGLVHVHFENYRGDIYADVAAKLYPRGTVDPEPWFAGAKLIAL